MKLIKVLQTVTKIEVKWTESEEEDDVIIQSTALNIAAMQASQHSVYWSCKIKTK